MYQTKKELSQMNNYKLSLDIDPKNDYEKAKKDWFVFLQTFSKLSPQEKERWVNEIFGQKNVNFARMMIQILGK